MNQKRGDMRQTVPATMRSRAAPIFLSLCLAGGLGALAYLRGDIASVNPARATASQPTASTADLQANHGPEENPPVVAPNGATKPDRAHATTEHRQTGGIDLAQTPVTPSGVREAAIVFRHGRENAFFDEEAFVRSFAAKGGSQAIDALRGELRNMDTLGALPENVNFLKDAPSEVLDRMTVIDMLGNLAKDDPAALGALVDIVNEPLNKDLPPQIINVLVGEKYDAFVELARHDWHMASATFAALKNEVLKDAMRPALIGGLVDIGTPPEDAVRMVSLI